MNVTWMPLGKKLKLPEIDGIQDLVMVVRLEFWQRSPTTFAAFAINHPLTPRSVCHRSRIDIIMATIVERRRMFQESVEASMYRDTRFSGSIEELGITIFYYRHAFISNSNTICWKFVVLYNGRANL